MLETNEVAVYSAFLRGLFEADGTVLEGVPSLATASEIFAAEVRTLLLSLGFATTTRQTMSGWGGRSFHVRMRNVDHALLSTRAFGFMGRRKNALVLNLSRRRLAVVTGCSFPETCGTLCTRRLGVPFDRGLVTGQEWWRVTRRPREHSRSDPR